MFKRKVKFYAVWLIACLMSATFILFFSCDEQKEEQSIAYEQINGYTLVLNEYFIPNENKVLKVIDPKGKEANFVSNPFIPTMAGVYQIVYQDKTEILNVLLKSDSLTFELNDYLLNEYAAGNTIKIPSVTIKDDYKTYSKYDVSVKRGGETINDFKSVMADTEISIELSDAGEYAIEYVCVDGFGQQKIKTVNFKVIDEPTIIYDSLANTFSYGETVDFGKPFGFYKGERYDVEISVKDSSQRTETTPDGKYVFKQTGEHTVFYQCNIGGQNIEKTETVNVVYSVKNVSCTENGNIGVHNVLPNYSKEEGYGALVIGSSDFTFNYEPVVDLNGLTKNNNLISFLPYSDQNSKLTDIILTLTDIYDENNSLTFYWYAKENWGKTHSYITVKRPNNTYGRSNEDSTVAEVAKGDVRPEGAVLYECSFFGYETNSSAMFSIQYDITENALYCNVRGEQWKVLDIDDDPAIEFKDRFYGFTTGEVYLSVKTINNSNAGIYITELAGKSFGGETINVGDYRNDYLVFEKYKPELPVGQVDFVYPIPQVKTVRNGSSVADFDVYVELNGERQSFENDIFIPRHAGDYVIVWAGSYKGFEIEKRKNFTVVQDLGEITVNLVDPAPVRAGDSYKLPEFTVSGINGEYKTTVTVKDDNRVFEQDMFGEYVLNTAADTVTVEIRVEDLELIGRKATINKTIPIIKETYLTFKGEIPKSVRAGANLKFTDFTVTNMGSEQSLVKKIIVNEDTPNERILNISDIYEVPDLSEITVRFVAGIGTLYESDKTRYTYTVKVISEDADERELFDVAPSTDIELEDEGLNFIASENGKVFTMPYSLPTNDLLIKFSLKTDETDFALLKFVFTDSVRQDKQVVISIFDILGDGYANMNISGDGTNYKLKYSINKEFYDFSFILSGYDREILDSAGDVAARISCFSDGTVFNGFSGKLAYLDVEFDGVTDASRFVLSQIANQKFGKGLISFQKKDNDNSGPVIFSDQRADEISAELNSEVKVPEFYAKDVLQAVFEITGSLISPKGEKIKKDVSAELLKSFTVSEYGTYKLVFTAVDQLGNKTEKTIFINVKDNIAPVITVDSAYKTQYSVGDKITVASATATDNYTQGIKIVVLIKDPTSRYTLISTGEEIKLNKTGSYKIVYRAEDEYHNIAIKEYAFIVKS